MVHSKPFPIMPKNSIFRTNPKRFLGQGKQTKITMRITAFASAFPGTTIETVKKIVDAVSRIKLVKFSEREIERVYSKRSAEKILSDGFVAIADKAKFGEVWARVNGCIDHNVVLCAILRAKGIPAMFVRRRNHSLTYFFLDGRWFVANPTNAITEREARRLGISIPGTEPVKPLTEKMLQKNATEAKEGGFAAGLDAWAIKIRNIRDFGKYDK
jgi:hypothetical protein